LDSLNKKGETMKYAIAKISEGVDSFSTMFGTQVAMDFDTSEFYDTIEEAEEAVFEKHQKEVDDSCDKIWKKGTEAQRKQWFKQLKNKNTYMVVKKYAIIPIIKTVEVCGLPEHLRGIR